MRKTQRIRIYITLFVLIAVALAFFGTQKKNRGTVEENRFLLGTVVSIRLYGSRDTELLNAAFNQIEAYENLLSRSRADSEISLINRRGRGTDLSNNLLDLLNRSLYYAEISEGALDPTVGPLVDLWGIGTENARVPSTEEIQGVLPLVDYRAVAISAQTVLLKQAGMALDLGSIAKGWIADRIAEFLRDGGAEHFLINLGGNVLVSGGKPNGESFRIGMQDPFDTRGRYLGVFTVQNHSVVSSGIYERFFEVDGIRYHHILNTATGVPVENDLAAVTILSENSVDGDALSTTAFILGLEKGLKLVESREGVEAAFITQEGKIILTPGAAERFVELHPQLDVEIHNRSSALHD